MGLTDPAAAICAVLPVRCFQGLRKAPAKLEGLNDQTVETGSRSGCTEIRFIEKIMLYTVLS